MFGFTIIRTKKLKDLEYRLNTALTDLRWKELDNELWEGLLSFRIQELEEQLRAALDRPSSPVVGSSHTNQPDAGPQDGQATPAGHAFARARQGIE